MSATARFNRGDKSVPPVRDPHPYMMSCTTCGYYVLDCTCYYSAECTRCELSPSDLADDNEGCEESLDGKHRWAVGDPENGYEIWTPKVDESTDDICGPIGGCGRPALYCRCP